MWRVLRLDGATELRLTMNFKTTGILFLLVLIVGGFIYYTETKSPPPAPTLAPEKNPAEEIAEKPVIDANFGDAAKIEVVVGKEPPWVFERDTDKGNPNQGWRMTAPMDCATMDWQVAQIATKLKNLKYAVSYPADSTEITAEQAGLNPPREKVTLTDESGKAITVEIGRNEGSQETYVRLADAKTIYRAKPALKNLLKDRALDYRENLLFVIDPGSIVKFNITERDENGDATDYEIVKSGTDWRFTQPAPAQAVADKIQKLISTMQTLRSLKWVDANPESLAAYGARPRTADRHRDDGKKRSMPTRWASHQQSKRIRIRSTSQTFTPSARTTTSSSRRRTPRRSERSCRPSLIRLDPISRNGATID
jgi:hypothetical protein